MFVGLGLKMTKLEELEDKIKTNKMRVEQYEKIIMKLILEVTEDLLELKKLKEGK